MTACAQTQPDAYEPPQDVEPDKDSLAYVEPPAREEPGDETEEEEPEEYERPQAYVADEPPVPSLTPEEIRDLLNSIPYPGMVEPWRIDWLDHPVVNSETAISMANFILRVNHWWGPPSASFHSPEEAGDFAWFAAFFNTDRVQWSDPDSTHTIYHPELKAIVPQLDSSVLNLYLPGITLHSHIEETAKNIFGYEISFPLWSGGGIFLPYDFSGTYIYVLGTFGVGAGFVPMILSYEETPDGYEVICAFVWLFDGRYYRPRSGIREGEAMSGDELLDYLRTTAERHTITLKNNSRGGFYYRAHILPGID